MQPEPPAWALEEGLPAPQSGETFIPYVQRLGLKPGPLLVDLTERTVVLANGRLATTLSRTMRPTFNRYIDRLAEKHITPQRRRELEMIGYRIFGDNFSRRPVV